MSGDLLELLFIAAFILFGLLGGRKKKRPPTPAPRTRPRPDTRAAASRTVAGPPAAARAGGSEQERLFRELEGLLTGRPPSKPAPASMRDLPDPDEAQSLEPLEGEEVGGWEEGLERSSASAGSTHWDAGRAREAESLETLEAAGGASHKRFHRLYDRPPESTVPQPPRLTFPTADLRRAVIWSEILAPPVSER